MVIFSFCADAERLTFPAEQNHVQVFPQQFEYSLMDDNHIRIGDILVDANKVSLQLVPQNKELSNFRFHFIFPASLMTEGELTIKDSVGKLLWIQTFKKNHLLINSKNSNTKYRDGMATFSSIPFEKDFLTKLENTSFFKFCVSKIDAGTKIILCSKELFLKYSQNIPSIFSREPYRKDSYVVINGRPVDPTGIVFLNKLTDPISLQALMRSGASVEIDTRRKDVVFTDVLQGENKDEILVRAKGTEPVDESKVKRISVDEWEISLPASRPTLFLKGEGGIPMRQEFLIKGPLRTESLKIEVTEGASKKTYSSEVRLRLNKPNEVTLAAGDKKSIVEGSTKTWILMDLEKGKTNKRTLQVIENENKFTTEYEIYRGYPILAFTRLMHPLFSQTQFQWWHGGFHLGAALNADKALTQSLTENDWSLFSAELLYRFEKGMNLDQSNTGLLLFANQATYGSKINLFGLGIFTNIKVSDPMIHWIYAKMQIPLSASGDNIKMKTSWNAEVSGKHFANESVFYEAGIRGFHYGFESSNTDLSFIRTMVFLGVGSLF